MRFYIPENGGLRLRESYIPKLNADEVLIEVKAIGLNRADILKIDGLYGKDDPSNVPGLEVAGYITGSSQKVMALVTHGGFANYVIAKKVHTIELDTNADFVEMAAIPEALTTCYMNLVVKAQAKKDDVVLIHGGSSGIGSLGIQMMKSLGCQVLATVGSAEKMDRVLGLGASEVLLYTEGYGQKWKTSVDVLLDVLGGEYFQQNIEVMARGGRICVIALMQGAKVQINVGQLLMKNLSIFGSTLKSQTDERKGEFIQEAYDMFKSRLVSGDVKPLIDSIYDFDDIPKAIERMRSRAHCGKIVVRL